MTVRELIKELQHFDSNARVLIASDEELNTLFGLFDVQQFSDSLVTELDELPNDKEAVLNNVVIYGLNGSEVN